MTTARYPLTDEDIERYEQDGVVCLRGVFDGDRVAKLADEMERVLASPGPQGKDYDIKGPGRFRYDTFMWTRHEPFWRVQVDSVLPQLTADLMRSTRSYLMADIMFVKEPQTPSPTPWHQDQPYGWYDGSQVCSVWIPLDRVTLESGALEYVAGSHRWNRWFRPVGFESGSHQATQRFEPMPDIEAERAHHRIVHFDMDPGDALFHHLLMLHGAPGNSMSGQRRRAIAYRYAGDDARYAVRDVGPKPVWDPGLSHGEPFGCELFPQVWPPGDVPRFWERRSPS